MTRRREARGQHGGGPRHSILQLEQREVTVVAAATEIGVQDDPGHGQLGVRDVQEVVFSQRDAEAGRAQRVSAAVWRELVSTRDTARRKRNNTEVS